MEPTQSVKKLIEESLAVERASADMGAALKLARQAQVLADQQGQPAEMAAARVAVARFRFRLGQYKAAQELAEKALEMTTPPNDATATSHANALLMLGMCLGESGFIDQAEQFYNRAADLAREVADPLLRFRSLHNLSATVYGFRGQFSLAIAADEEARQIAHQYGLHEWLYFPLITLSWNLQITGQIARARTSLEELRQVSSPQAGGTAYSDYISALLDMDEGYLDSIPEQLGRARTIAERTGDSGLGVEVRLGMCRYHRLAGNLAKAQEWAEDALMLARNRGYLIKEADSLVEHGRIHWLRGDIAAAEEDLHQAAEYYSKNKGNYDLAYIALLQAAIDRQQNRPQAAAAWLKCTCMVDEHEYYFLLQRERDLAYPLIATFLDSPGKELSAASAILLTKLQEVPPAPLRIYLLGGLRVWRGRCPIPKTALRPRRAGELLSLLLLAPGHTLAVEQAAEALSPEAMPEASQMIVYQATSALRRALEPELPDRRFPSRYLEVSERSISLHLPDGSWSDFQAFEQAARKKDWEQALALYEGELLPEYRYADWATVQRESLAERYHDALLALAQAHLENQDWPAALEFARRLIQLDAWHEDAVMVAMRACQGLKDLASARRYYKRLETSLREDLDIAPQEPLQILYRSLGTHHK